jgi:DNA polymerase-3 subunit epsilon
MDFVALDFETANAALSSICQVGLVSFQDGKVIETFSSLVDPDDYFDPMNVSIHGIDEESVEGAPVFTAIYPEIYRRVTNAIVVCHSLFDKAALEQASFKNRLSPVQCRCLDNTRVARRAWDKYAYTGYGLANLTRAFGITFNHHDAAEDARATGEILIRAMNETGLTLDDWLVRVTKPLNGSNCGPITREGKSDGLLAGEVAVFTGALSMPRHEAADRAALVGCRVDAGVTKDTTLLIVGDQDVTKLAPGHVKSSKHLKAETLIAKGQAIRILRETDFLRLVAA